MSEIVDRIEVIDGTFLMSRPGYYFGYGLESVPEVMDSILGRSVTAELGVTAVKQQLVVQEIDQVPDKPTEQLGGKSPQQVLAEAWRQHTDVPFSSYALRPTEARSSVVGGTLYEIDLEDAHRLTRWDILLPFERGESGKTLWPGWRVWDRAIELADGRKVETLTIDQEQAIDRVVDGIGYNPFLNDRQTTLRVIEGFVDGLKE